MTLTPLSSINFVNTTIKVSPKTTYVSASSDCNNFGELSISSAGESGIVNDRSDFSKSIIPNIVSGSFDANRHSNISDTSKNILSDENVDDSYEDLIEKLDAIKVNDSLSEVNANNFKNYFKISRNVQNFLYGDHQLDRKNYLKNLVYPYYRHNKDNDNLNNIYWGFSNYNCLNFFSQDFSGYKNHTNCLAYPNFYKNNKYEYDFLSKSSFNVSFFINKRKTGEIKKDQCILHIPKAFTIFLISGTSTNTSGNINKYKLKIKYYVSDNNFSSFETPECITSNNWNYISINFINKEYFNYRVDIIADDQLIKSEDIVTTFKSSNFDSLILIGNKFNNDTNYTDNSEASLSGIEDNSLLRKRLFSNNNNAVIESKFITNIENLENSTQIDSNDIDLFTNDVYTDGSISTYNLNSLDAELSDIRIYSSSLDDEKIKFNRLNSVSNIQSEILNNNLCFYLPFYFVPVSIFKETLYNSSNYTEKLTHTSPVNPYFSNFSGGLEVNVENFVFEFVRKQTPNIIIGGLNKENFYKDTSYNSVDNLIKYKSGNDDNDNSKIRKGISANEIYTKNILSGTISDNDKKNNLIYRNNMILPNDNGIQKQNFDIINEVFSTFEGYTSQYNLIENINERESNSSFGTQLDDQMSKNYHVSMEKIYDSSNFSELYNKEYQDNSFTLKSQIPSFTEDKIENIYEVTDDSLYAISNVLYQKDIDIDNWLSHQVGISTNQSDKYQDFYHLNLSNPLTRKYKEKYNTVTNKLTGWFNLEVIDRSNYEKSISNNNINYKSIPLPYRDIISDDSYFHSIIMDVSSQIYNNKIKKGSFNLKDIDLHGTNSNLKITLKDDSYGCLYRSDCETEVAEWNYVGHVFYSEGIATIHHPGISNFGGNNFTCEFESIRSLFVNEINIPCESGKINKSYNTTYNEDLRASESAFDHDEKFVYITDINLHDENLNIVAKAKLAQPVPKKSSDNIVFRLKMDY